jgi:hypothetical protein
MNSYEKALLGQQYKNSNYHSRDTFRIDVPEVCFLFQSKNGCRNPDCKFLHFYPSPKTEGWFQLREELLSMIRNKNIKNLKLKPYLELKDFVE